MLSLSEQAAFLMQLSDLQREKSLCLKELALLKDKVANVCKTIERVDVAIKAVYENLENPGGTNDH